jgi:hypothetical protein
MLINVLIDMMRSRVDVLPVNGMDTDNDEPLDPMRYLSDLECPPAFSPGRSRPSSLYASHPLSEFRPRGQFITEPDMSNEPAVFTVITVTYNPRQYIFRVARFMQEQSLQAFRWLVVNDHTDDSVALQRLHELRNLAARDWRVRIVDNQGARGGPSAMNFGMRFVNTPFVAILDDDDLWELTTLEKAALVMSWVPSAYAVGFDVINHGAKEFIWTRGFYNGDENYYFENSLVQGSPMRSIVLKECPFSTDFSGGAADWDMWMCMASKGMWGLHIPENGTWYQVNPASFREKRWKNLASVESLANTHAKIIQKHARILGKDEAWPAAMPPAINESMCQWGLPSFSNHAAPMRDKRILIIITSLKPSAVSYEMLRYVNAMATQGWRVTVLAIHPTNDNSMKDLFMQFTHDIFIGHLIAPVNHLPRLLNYLIESRRIDTVLVAQSSFAYDILPIIFAYRPQVRIIDYLADCDPANRALQASIKNDNYIDMTLVPTSKVHACATSQGKSVVKLMMSRGIDADFCQCGLLSPDDRRAFRPNLGMGPNEVLIGVVDDPLTAELIFDSLLVVLRDRWLRNITLIDGLRVYWPEVPQDKLSANDYAARAWLVPPKGVHVWPTVDIVVTASSHYRLPHFYGCYGATVITDDRYSLHTEPSWEWGNGEIVKTSTLFSAVSVMELAQHINHAVNKSERSNPLIYYPMSQGALVLLQGGTVVCHGTRIIERAQSAVRKTRQIMDTTAKLQQVLTKAVAKESLFDMKTIQHRLQHRKLRNGFGRVLQKKCPERIFQNTAWIDALEAVKSCEGATIDADALRQVAMEQCGAWCIANTAEVSPAILGWALKGTCWNTVVSHNDACAAHITSVLKTKKLDQT